LARDSKDKPFAELRVRVTPRSSQNKVERHGEQVKVWVTASPTDGQANEAVCRIVAETLDVPPSAVRVVRGQTSREKTIGVSGLALAEALAKIPSP